MLLLAQPALHAQNKDIKIGSDLSQFKQVNNAVYDFSEPDKINITVSIWGAVRMPGKYIVPVNTTVIDLVSFAGAPTETANLEDLRVYRTFEDSTYKIIKFNLKHFLDEKDANKMVLPPQLQASDIIIFPGEQKLYFRDYLSLTLSIVSTVVSLTILILNIAKK